MRVCGSWVALATLLLAVGCQRTSDDGREREVETWTAGQSSVEVVQDLSDGQTRLFASVQPTLPHSDAPRRLRVRWLERGGERAWPYAQRDVLDARLIPDSHGALVISEARELVWLESRTARPLALDTKVQAPLSLSRDGRFVAYTRGEAPDVEVVRYDLTQRREAGVTQNMAPTWSPALSPDGARVIFVSGSTGFPELYELSGDGSVVQLSERQSDPVPFPSGPSAPIWSGNYLAFESQESVHVLSLAPLRHQRTLRGGLPVATPREDGILVQPRAGGAARWESLSTEVSR